MAALAYLAFTADIGDSKAGYELPKDFFGTFVNKSVISEFMKKDGIILIVVTGGFLLARSYNNYLDQLDLEEYNKELEKRKLEGTYVSSSDSENDEKEEAKPKRRPPPLNPIN